MSLDSLTPRALVAAALLAIVLPACSGDATGEARPTEPAPTFVETAPVIVDDVEVAIDAVGTLRPYRRVEVRSRSEGVIAAVMVAEGEAVALGDPLVQLDATKLAAEARLREATLVAARARAVNARSTLQRSTDLLKRGFIPQQEFDDARAGAAAADASVDEAEAALVVARELLRDADVRAPIAGVAGEAAVDPGDYVRNGDPLLTIVDADPVEVEFSVPEEHLAKLAVGRAVSVEVPSYSDERFEGTVTYIDPEVQPDTHAVRLKATIPNADLRLRPGQFAAVRAILEVHRASILVPEEAIVPEGTATWVYVVTDGHAERRKVDLGVRREGQVEVTDGLRAEEVVVVNGHFRLRDGGAVQIAESVPAEG